MLNNKPVSALIDTSIRSHGRLVSGFVDRSTYSNGIACYKAGPRNPDPWLAHQIECLPTIARIAHENRVNLYSHSWLRMEAYPALSYPSFADFGDIFFGVKFKEATSPISIPRWMEISLGKEASSSFVNLAEYFCRTDFQESHSLKSICRKIGKEHYQDALHLWVAVENDLDFFITNDKKFFNRISNTNLKRRIKSRICLPEDFVKKFGFESPRVF